MASKTTDKGTKRDAEDIAAGTRDEKKQKDAKAALEQYLAAKGPLDLPTTFGPEIEEKDFKPLMDQVTKRINNFISHYRLAVWEESDEAIVQEDYAEPMNAANPDERGLTEQAMLEIKHSSQSAKVNVRDSLTSEEKHWGFDQVLWFTAKQGTTVKRIVVLLQAKIVKTMVGKKEGAVPMKSIDFGYKGGHQLDDLGHAINRLRSKVDTKAAIETIVIGGYLGFHEDYVVYIPQEMVYADLQKKKLDGKFNWSAFSRIQATEYLQTPAQFGLSSIFARALNPGIVTDSKEVEPEFETMANIDLEEEVDNTPPGDFPQSVIKKLQFKDFEHDYFKDSFESAAKYVSTFVKDMQVYGVTPDERGLTDQLVVQLTDAESKYKHPNFGFTFITCGQQFESKWAYDQLWSYTPDKTTNVILLLQAKKQKGAEKVVNYVYKKGKQLKRLQEAQPKVKKAAIAGKPELNGHLVVITAYLIYGPDDVLLIPLDAVLEQNKTKTTDEALSKYFNDNKKDFTAAKFVNYVSEVIAKK